MWLHSSSNSSTSPPFPPPPTHTPFPCPQLHAKLPRWTRGDSDRSKLWAGLRSLQGEEATAGLAQPCGSPGADAALLFCSQAIAASGATLYMLCRNQQRGQEAADKVKQASGNSDVHLAVSVRNVQCQLQ